jgi:hypothetical protein
MTTEEKLREVALDWLENSDDADTKALRGYVRKMLSEYLLQIEAMRKALAQYINVFLPGGVCPANDLFHPGGLCAEKRKSDSTPYDTSSSRGVPETPA